MTWSGLKLKFGYFKNFDYNIKEPFLRILHVELICLDHQYLFKQLWKQSFSFLQVRLFFPVVYPKLLKF